MPTLLTPTEPSRNSRPARFSPRNETLLTAPLRKPLAIQQIRSWDRVPKPRRLRPIVDRPQAAQDDGSAGAAQPGATAGEGGDASGEDGDADDEDDRAWGESILDHAARKPDYRLFLEMLCRGEPVEPARLAPYPYLAELARELVKQAARPGPDDDLYRTLTKPEYLVRLAAHFRGERPACNRQFLSQWYDKEVARFGVETLARAGVVREPALPGDPLYAALTNPEVVVAFEHLRKSRATRLSFEMLEARYGAIVGPVAAGNRAPASGKFGEVAQRVVEARVGERHDALARLALMLAHRMVSLGEVRHVLRVWMDRNPAFDAEYEPGAREFESIVSTAWSKALARPAPWRADRGGARLTALAASTADAGWKSGGNQSHTSEGDHAGRREPEPGKVARDVRPPVLRRGFNWCVPRRRRENGRG